MSDANSLLMAILSLDAYNRDNEPGLDKQVAASIGDISTVFSRSPAHKLFTFADMDWMVLPSVFRGQFHVAEIANNDSGLHAPIAVATRAFVSEEVGQRTATRRSHYVPTPGGLACSFEQIV